MTVLLALLTEEGIVFASDSRETFFQGGRWLAREPVQKIYPLGNSILYGASGEIGMTQRITAELEKRFKGEEGLFKRSIDQLKLTLRDTIVPILKDTSEHLIRVPGWPDPQLHTIFCGFTNDKHWILEVDPRGNIEEHTHRGFCAVGSGGLTGQFAIQCLAHLQISTSKIFQGKIVAYRIIDDVIRSGDLWVGGDVQIFILTKGSTQKIEPPELHGIQDSVGMWKEIEKDTLAQLKEPD